MPDSQRRDLVDLRPRNHVKRALEESAFEGPKCEWRYGAENVLEPFDRLIDVWNRDPNVVGAYETEPPLPTPWRAWVGVACARSAPTIGPAAAAPTTRAAFERNVLRVSPPWISLLTAPPFLARSRVSEPLTSARACRCVRPHPP